MTKYIRIWGRDTWHWMPNCQHTKRLVTQLDRIESRNSYVRPMIGELCNECLAKEIKERKDAKNSSKKQNSCSTK